MYELLEVFAIKDAFYEYECLDLGSASLSLIRAMGYPVKLHNDVENHKIENFIYFTVQNKSHYNVQEMMHLKKIKTASFLCELEYHDLIDEKNYSNDTIVFLAIEIISLRKNRSEDSYYISKILDKAYDGFIVLIIKNADHIMFCATINEQNTCMSEWYNINCTCVDLFPLCAVCYPYITGVRNVKDYFYELAYGFSREYIRYPESYDFVAYQALTYIEIDTENGFITKQKIKEIAEKSSNYYKDIYNYDYVYTDSSFAVLLEEDDEWTLQELDNVELTDDEINNSEYYEDDNTKLIEYFEIDSESEEYLNDPVEMLKWLEERDKKTSSE